MKYLLGLFGLINVVQCFAMDRPPQAKPSSNKPVRLSGVIDIKKLDDFFKILQEKKFEPNSEQYVFIARRLFIHDKLLTEFAARHQISKLEMKELLEIFLNQASRKIYNALFEQKNLIQMYKEDGLTHEQAITVLFLIGLIEEYNHAQDYEDTKTEKFLPSRTHQELELIDKNVNRALKDKLVQRSIFQIFAKNGLQLLKNFQSQSAQLLAANPPVQQQPAAITKKQQQNADYLYQVYQEARNDFDTYLQLKPSNELERIRTFVQETRNPVMQTYLLQKMSQEEINSFQHIYYKISDILKSRSKSKQIPNGLTENQQLLYMFVGSYIKDGDKYKLNLTDQNKNNIRATTQAIMDDQEAINKFATWLSIKPQTLKIILNKITGMFKRPELPVIVEPSATEVPQCPWPDYPEEAAPIEKAPQSPVAIQAIRDFNVADFIKYAQDDNNAALNKLINESSDEQLQTVLKQLDALIKADEKVVRKYQERFEVKPRKDLAKLRLLMQSIDQELKRRKAEFFMRHPQNRPHPEYPESPR